MRHLALPEFDLWANDPDMLRERRAPVATYDNSGLFEDDAGFALEHDTGCMVFVYMDGVGWFSRYDIHFLFPPTCRGQKGVNAALQMIDQAFVHEGLGELHGSIPHWNKPARFFIRALGFDCIGSDAELMHYRLTRTEWRAQCGLPEHGSITHTPLDIAVRSEAYLRTIF